MPCADGELCLVPANSPKDPDGHGCQGCCGGRLHDICGSIADDENENHRMCSACVVKAGKRKAKAAEGAETGQEQAGKRKAKAAEGEEEEKEDGGDESAERGRDAPPAYAELSAHFGVLESAAEKSGNADAAHYLSKARMAMILAHAASERARQT